MGTWCRGVEAAQTPPLRRVPWWSLGIPIPSAQGRGRILLPALSAPSLLSQGLGALGGTGGSSEATSPGPTSISGGTDPGPHEHNAFTGLEREEEEGREG